jgi:two-component system OmpR family sensor kinase
VPGIACGTIVRTWTRLSLRLRLTLAFALGMAAVLAALGGFLYERLGAELLQGVDLELRSRAEGIVSALGERRPVDIDTGRRLIDPDEAFAQVLDSSGGIVETTPAVRAAPMLPAGATRSVSGPTFLSRRVTGVDDPARVLAVPAEAAGRPVVVVVGATLGNRDEALDRLLLLLTIGGPIALLLSSMAGWAVAGAALRPVERMRVEAAAISESEADRLLPVPGTGDELARLAETLNGMLGRLQQALEREHRFVDQASHELRTPLAILKAELDLALARPRSAAELHAAVRSASAETDRLIQLAEDLLVLARTNGGRLPLRRVPVSLRELLEGAAATFQARARAVGSRIEVAAPDERVSLDPVRLRQAVQNLLDNAIRHGGGTQPIAVTGERVDGTVRITVQDGGRGFPAPVLERAFEPFSRSPAPADGALGAGLGLAIVRAVAEAHGGHAGAANAETGGARVVLIVQA